jgi:PAS domain S-box-containing protein
MTANTSIARRLNAILTKTTLVALLLAGVALVAFDLVSQLRRLEKDLVAQADMVGLVSATAVAFNDQKAAIESLSALRANSGVTAAAIFDETGQPFAVFNPSGRGPATIPVKAKADEVSVDRTSVHVWRPITVNNERIGTFYVAEDHGLLSRAAESIAALTLILLASFAAALSLAKNLQKTISGPVIAVSDVARKIMEARDFSLRAPKTSDDEVGAMVDLFNGMLDELQVRATTLEKANEALRESDERYQLAVRGSSAGLWDWDMLAHTVFYSPRFKALMGYRPDEFPDLHSTPGRYMHEDDKVLVRKALSEHLRSDKPYQVECRMRLNSGRWHWFLIAGTALKDGSGRPFRMAGSIIDVTERKAAEQILLEANRAKDAFLATLAHELRNPLAPIRTSLAILKKDTANGPLSVQARQTMERQLLHMVRLIDDLMDISRINNGKISLDKTRISLGAVVSLAVELSQPVISSRRHNLQMQLPPDDVLLMGDMTRLGQAIGNLLNNAAKYTPEGGTIVLSVHQLGGEVTIEVTDSGVGIPEHLTEQVFELFTQVGRTIDQSQGGLGIGLFLVRSLVELHGGSVKASSPGVNMGSTFTVSLPCLMVAASGDAGLAPAPETPTNGAARRILVADDNVDAADSLAAVLQMMGHETRTVYHGAQVVDVARNFRPEIVLQDIGMPGKTGLEIARELRADRQLGSIVLIAVTGWGNELDRARSLEAGFDAHMTKPVDVSQLELLLERTAIA